VFEFVGRVVVGLLACGLLCAFAIIGGFAWTCWRERRQPKEQPQETPTGHWHLAPLPEMGTVTRFETQLPNGTIKVEWVRTTQEVANEMAVVNKSNRHISARQTLSIAERRIQERAK
jgi:hypothetical protein